MLYPVGALDGCGGERLAWAVGSAAPWVRVRVRVRGRIRVRDRNHVRNHVRVRAR